MEQYPAVAFMVRHGRWLATVVGLAPLVFAALGIAVLDWSWLAGAGGVVAGVGLGFAFRTFAELTQIIADMLLPQ